MQLLIHNLVARRILLYTFKGQSIRAESFRCPLTGMLCVPLFPIRALHSLIGQVDELFRMLAFLVLEC